MYKHLSPKAIIAGLMLLGPLSVVAQSPFKGLENLFTIPKGYIVNYTKTPPVIDGDLNDAAWQQARWTDDFVDIEGDRKPKPPLQTNVKMLWDDSCLYIAGRIMDPNVWAYFKHRDDIVFHENDLEFFIDPNGTTHEYFELEYNAINTIFDLYLNKPYRNNGNPMGNWDAKGMRSAVKVQGTLNDPSDVDKGWTLEVSIPFKALGSGYRSTPREGAVWRLNISRVEWDTKAVDGKYVKLKDSTGRTLPEHNWVWSPQGLINMHFPERWGYVQFSKKNDNNAVFALPYAELQKQYLWLIYYKQREWRGQHSEYAQSVDKFNLGSKVTINGRANNLQIEATAHQFMATITDEADHITWTINQEGLIGQLNNN